MTENRVLFDYDRAARTSVPEAVFCQSKSREVIYSLMEEFSQADAPGNSFYPGSVKRSSPPVPPK